MTRFMFASGMMVEREIGDKSDIWRLSVKGSQDLGPIELRMAATEAELFVTKMREAADQIEADRQKEGA
jgi:hypothetical protein